MESSSFKIPLSSAIPKNTQLVSDLKVERHNSKTGWRSTEGSIMKATSLWKPCQPNNYNGNQDCVYVDRLILDDNSCKGQHKFICQKKTKSMFSSYFKSQSRRQNNFDSGDINCTFGTAIHEIKSRLQCGVHCAAQAGNSCVAFYYNELVGLCVYIKYFAVAINIEANWKWTKYIRVP